MLETLIDRQNHHFAGSGKFTGHQNSGDVRFRPRVVAFVVIQNFLNALDLRGLAIGGVVTQFSNLVKNSILQNYNNCQDV